MYIKNNLFILMLSSIFSINIYSLSIEQIAIEHKDRFSEIALEIWNHAEMGYQEIKSSNLLAAELEKEGFKITRNVAGIPTAFIAEYGSSGPVIGILGEFDALPGLAQSTSPFKEVIDNGTGAGHACGHHLFGAASAWAAVTVKEWLEKNNIEGIIRFYGTPAEEGGSGKVYMVREGLFNDVDVVLHWHPDDINSANSRTSNSNKSAKFTFNGVVKTAEGAAIGTDTSMSYEVMHGNYSLLPNDVVQKIMHKNLNNFGGITYSKDENEYANTIYKTFVKPSLKIGSQENVSPFKTSHSYGSTDVGDVSWVVPTAGIRTATWVPGTAAHSWQAVASGGTTIGIKGTELAAKTIAATAVEIFTDPSIVQAAKNELNQRVGDDFIYKALLGERSPPLNYRVN